MAYFKAVVKFRYKIKQCGVDHHTSRYVLTLIPVVLIDADFGVTLGLPFNFMRFLSVDHVLFAF